MCCDLAGFFSQTPREARLDDVLVAARSYSTQANFPLLATSEIITNCYANMHTTNFAGGEIRGQVRRGLGHDKGGE
jgi:CHRD domain-containing protein